MVRCVKLGAAVGAALMLASCSGLLGTDGGAGTAETENGKPVPPKAATPAIAFFADKCPVSQEDPRLESLSVIVAGVATTLVNTVLPPILEVGVTRVADWLDARAMALSASTSATADGFLYTRSSDRNFVHRHGCLVFARGGFGTSTSTPSGTWTTGTFERVNDTLQLADKRLRLASRPEVYAEFRLVYKRSEIEPIEGTAGAPRRLYNEIGLQPVFVDYGRIGAQREGDGSKNLIFNVTFDSRSMRLTEKDSPTFVNALVDLGRLRGTGGGTTLRLADLEHKPPQVFRIPQPAIVTVKDEAGKDVGRTDDFIPLTATVALTETDEGGDYERAAAEAIRKNKADIVKSAADPAGQAFKKWINNTLGVKQDGAQGG